MRWARMARALAPLLAVVSVAACSGHTGARVGAPNIILITIDTLRADHLGVYGYTRRTSPNIDAFGREAIVVSDGVSQAPYTKASIASLLTGLLPSTHKTWSSSVPLPQIMTGTTGEHRLPVTDVLPANLPLLPEVLRDAGYETLAFTTNPFLIPDFGFARGFDHFRFFDGPTFASAEAVLPEALAAAKTRHARPFFLWVHLMEPHSPYAPTQEARDLLPPLRPARMIPDSVNIPPWLLQKPSRDLRLFEASYDAEIRTVDAAIGRFFAGLRHAGLWDQSAVIVTSDHGEEFLEHGGLEHNRTVYDEMIRVPMLLRIPGVKSGRLEAQVEVMDLFPTLVAIAGGRPPEGLFGSNMLPLLEAGQGEDRFAVTELVGSATALRTPEWKLIETTDGRRELYHLTADPRERRDVSGAERERVDRLSAVLHGIQGRAETLAKSVTRQATAVRPSVFDRLRALGYIGSSGIASDR